MPEIRQLSASVINKIAAGEVIERPASVVKELIENAVDAGARRVEVALGQGGSEYIRVSDDGCGIHPDQLLLAVASHATSKIRDADDLFQVATLGFRGEALASISEVSRFLIRSRTPDLAAGAQLEVIGGQLGPVEPCGCGPGTTIEVRDLFFNTPVRRKFLRASATEVGHATEAFTRVALASPEVHFVFKHNDRTIYDLPPTSSWPERIAAFFGREVGQALIAMDGSEGELRLSGYVGDPQVSRPNNRLQYLFLNGRCIRDRSLQHALGEAYRGLLLTGRFPVAFLRLDMPAELVDVNVHPTKMEVRFQDSGRIYAHLLGTLRRKFLASDLTARVQSGPKETGGVTATTPAGTSSSASYSGSGGAKRGTDSPEVERGLGGSGGTARPLPNFQAWEAWTAGGGRGAEAHDAQEAARRRQDLVSWAQGRGARTAGDESDTSDRSADDVSRRPATSDAAATTSWRDDAAVLAPHSRHSEASATTFARGAETAADLFDSTDLPATDGGDRERRDEPATRPGAVRVAASQQPPGVQLHDRYLVTETEDGIVIIDQHALHERVIYEQLREKLATGKFETQRLLVPQPINLSGAEAAVLLEAREILARLGIGIEPFGGGTVLVTSYPAMLSGIGPSEVVRQVLERLMAGGKTLERHDLVEELLAMMSCKAAVKFGDRLTSDEVQALLAQRHLFHDTHHCPHGRPTALVFTRDELDKRFKRI